MNSKFSFIKIVSLVVCFSIIVLSIPLLIQPISSSAETRNMGLWWWWPEDGRDATLRDQYLSFFDKAGITEIYYYGYDDLVSNPEALHTFVQDANSRGMKVSILYDNVKICDEANSSGLIDSLYNFYLKYVDTYKTDQMNGYHFDIERFTNYQDYCTNFIGGIQKLREANIPVSVDVNPTKWTASVSLNGISGMYNIIAANVDTMSLMSYRQNADKVISCGETCLAACKKYNTAISYGLETDDSGEDGVDFHEKTIEQLYSVIDNVFGQLNNKNLEIPYGMSIHQNRSFYIMEGQLPDKNRTTAPKPTVIGGEVVGHMLYQNLKLDIQEYVQSDTTFKYSNDELAQALKKDFAENGLINNDLGEYYQLTIHVKGSRSGYAYPCLWDAEDGWDFWATNSKEDYPNGSVIRTTESDIISKIHSLYNSKSQANGQFVNDSDGICIYVEEYSQNLTITGITVEVFRLEGGTVITAPTETTTTISTTTSQNNLLPGDVNNDSVIDMKDVLAVRKFIASLDPGTQFNFDLADANMDHEVDMKDVLLIRKTIANI